VRFIGGRKGLGRLGCELDLRRDLAFTTLGETLFDTLINNLSGFILFDI